MSKWLLRRTPTPFVLGIFAQVTVAGCAAANPIAPRPDFSRSSDAISCAFLLLLHWRSSRQSIKMNRAARNAE